MVAAVAYRGVPGHLNPEVSRDRDLRDRDLQKYYHPWRDAKNLVGWGSSRDGLTYEGYQAQNSRDKALTAFAQLGVLRLGVRRAMVSLIDSHQQYILAEATKTLSLMARGADRPEDEIWLGNTIVAKEDALCHRTFGSTYTAREEDGDDYVANCLVVPDCRLDDRFRGKSYVKEGIVRFYAGVPITTRAGYHIGVYAVSDEKPREGLSADNVRMLQDLAAVVMDHLELAKDREDRYKGERMVRGLTDFIESSSVQDLECETSNSRQTVLDKQTENAKLEDTVEDEARPTTPSRNKLSASKKQLAEVDQDGPESFRIFQRAARSIRQSTDADGVIFFDTSKAGIVAMIRDPSSPVGSSDESHHSSTTDLNMADSTSTARSMRRRARERSADKETEVHIRDAERDVEGAEPTTEAELDKSKACPVAGMSLSSKCSELISDQKLCFTEAAMERYIRRYPYGKCFSFNEEGTGVNSSDEKSERSEPDHSGTSLGASSTRSSRPRLGLRRGGKFTPTELLQFLSNVRSLIFLPLWDPASERWIAGGFIWSTVTGKLANPESELLYFKAFANSITSEVARFNAQKSDRAKTTFIASISHELRSPLHGILGSVEFLHDTTLENPYQASLISTIETCGRTLLDTIDHVLEYAKINKLRAGNKSRRRQRTHMSSSSSQSKQAPTDNSILGVTTDFNLAQLVEEVCETVVNGHMFKKSRSLVRLGLADTRIDGVMAHGVNGGGVESTDNETKEKRMPVAVTLDMATSVNWIVRSQPGALRRILMNLLGNSLKYTDEGYVAVSLVARDSGSKLVNFTLSVEDSGRGMSDEYQNTRLFAPFSQEDPFSNGTGLGLSIVKQIVESLGGEIMVESHLGAGTRVNVDIRLPVVAMSEKALESHLLTQSPDTLRGQTASLVFPNEKLNGGGERIGASLRKACEGFGMKVTDQLDLTTAQPNLILTEPVSLEATLSNKAVQEAAKGRLMPQIAICICADPTEQTRLHARFQSRYAALGWVIEVVCQPCGPRKLVRLLLDTQIRAAQESRQRFMAGRSRSSEDGLSASGAAVKTTLEKQDDAQDVLTTNQDLVEAMAVQHSGNKAETASPAIVMEWSRTRSPHTSTASPHLLSAEPAYSPGAPALPSAELQMNSRPGEALASVSESTSYFPANSVAHHVARTTPRVLLVDDNAINLKLLVVFARRQGIAYEEAKNGLEAVELYRREAHLSHTAPTEDTSISTSPTCEGGDGPKPGSATSKTITETGPLPAFDFILMDLSMPFMDGLEATRRIRAYEAEKGLPRSTIVALTGLASAQDQQDAVDAGVDMYLVKPVRFADIQSVFGVGSK